MLGVRFWRHGIDTASKTMGTYQCEAQSSEHGPWSTISRWISVVHLVQTTSVASDLVPRDGTLQLWGTSCPVLCVSSSVTTLLGNWISLLPGADGRLNANNAELVHDDQHAKTGGRDETQHSNAGERDDIPHHATAHHREDLQAIERGKNLLKLVPEPRHEEQDHEPTRPADLGHTSQREVDRTSLSCQHLSPKESFGHGEEHVRRDPRETGEEVLRCHVPSPERVATSIAKTESNVHPSTRMERAMRAENMRKTTTMFIGACFKARLHVRKWAPPATIRAHLKAVAAKSRQAGSHTALLVKPPSPTHTKSTNKDTNNLAPCLAAHATHSEQVGRKLRGHFLFPVIKLFHIFDREKRLLHLLRCRL